MSELTDAVVGTKIAVREQYSSLYRILTVTAVSDKTVHCNYSRFRKSDGLLIGSAGTWTSRYACIAGEEHLMEDRIRNASQRVSKIKISKKNIDAIEAFITQSEADYTAGDSNEINSLLLL